ncbi:MAG: hypothetical protein US99_C0078G0001, partial [Candidatus Daviesbacteria bacterium GW2011_GWF2_38_6]
MKFLLFGFAFLLLVPFAKIASAQFVNVVNPVRISSYTKDPKKALLAQYKQVNIRNLPATWLLTYDVLVNPDTRPDILGFDNLQETGVFLEVTPKFAGAAGVLYSKTDSWHRANAVFLSGYVQEDRIKLIDTIFEEFKKAFGFYPASVGAWWVDSFSLDYMKKKYDILANLTVADQFSTDGYKLWGQFWSVPFYPNKYHAGVPARTVENDSAGNPEEKWLITDTKLKSADIKDHKLFLNFEKLVDLYTKQDGNMFGQVTIGLEGDFTPEVYGGNYSRQLDIIKEKQDAGQIRVLTMKDFSNKYRNMFPKLSPVQIVQTDDLLGKNMKTFWFQSLAYRINITYDYELNKTYVNDFRSYHSDFEEPYYFSPNRDLNLHINIPPIIDSAGNPEEKWLITDTKLKSADIKDHKLFLNFEK